MFFVIFVLLGITFGYAAGWPWGLLVFIVPALLVLGATDRSGLAIVIGFVLTAIGLMVGFLLAARSREREA